MTEATSEGARVIGAGVLVTIAGEERRLFFDFAALELIEDEFDGLLYFTQALNNGFRGKQIKALRVGLLAGGRRAGVTPREVEALVARLRGREDFVEQVTAVIAGISEAFDQAIPPPPSKRARSSSKASARESASHGPESTAEPSSRPESNQVTSGT